MCTTSDQAPSWYVSPEEQIAWVKKRILSGITPGISAEDIPRIPEFTPNSLNEVLMLAVYLPDKLNTKGLTLTFAVYIRMLEEDLARNGHAFTCPAFLGKIPSPQLRMFNEVEYRPGIRWIAYDPTAYAGLAVNYVRTVIKPHHGFTLAGVEILQSALMFPSLYNMWTSRVRAARRQDVLPAPYVSGLDVDIYNHRADHQPYDWDYLPVFERYVRRRNRLVDNTKLALEMVVPGYRSDWHSSPTVRILE